MAQLVYSYLAEWGHPPSHTDAYFGAKMAIKQRARGGTEKNFPWPIRADAIAQRELTEEDQEFLKTIPFSGTRIAFEKMEWEHALRLKEGRCRNYNCERDTTGVVMRKCPCRSEGVVYCSIECQKEDWSLMHRQKCSAAKKKVPKKKI